MILNLDEEFEKQKKAKKRAALMEWRKKNPEKYKKIQEKAVLKYRLKNSKKHAENSLNYYYKHREEILKKLKEKRDKIKKEKQK